MIGACDYWVERFGCPFCGASSNEPCINQADMAAAFVPHDERVAFAAKHGRGGAKRT